MPNQWTEWCARIRVVLPPTVSTRQRRELGAFARYCAQRIERDLGVLDQWTVSVVTGARGEYATVVSVRRHWELEGRGVGPDAVLTIWDAMCRLEQAVREARPGPRRPSLLA